LSASSSSPESSSSESSRERRRRRHKSRKLKEKKRRQAKLDKQSEEERWKTAETVIDKRESLDHDEIERIIQQEGIETAMRADSFVFLSYCLRENYDGELKKIFTQFKADEDSMRLLSLLMCSCEDKLLAFFEKNFSNIEIGQLNKLRQQRDSRYIDAFDDFRASKNIRRLTESLRALV
jgi:hypothetical protein